MFDRWKPVKSDTFPVWTGNKWLYRGTCYRSLRVLKSNLEYKQSIWLKNAMSDEIRKEIDQEIIQCIISIAEGKDG